MYIPLYILSSPALPLSQFDIEMYDPQQAKRNERPSFNDGGKFADWDNGRAGELKIYKGMYI